MANVSKLQADNASSLNAHGAENPSKSVHRPTAGYQSGQGKDRISARASISTTMSEEQTQDSSADNDSEVLDEDYAASRHPHSHSHLRRASPASHTDTPSAYTAAESRTVLRKLDRNLTLTLCLLYLLSFLDRSNIGSARIAGLQSSLGISSAEFDWTLLAFYITYITFEWMILLYRIVPAHIYIPSCVFAWGLIACLQSVVTRFAHLLVLRALLGITEAAFGPGVPFYMTFFYRREELAYRVGLQISAAPLATSFASGLAWVVLKGGELLSVPVDGWRLLFLIEGFPSIIVAVLAVWIVPDGPESARWLTPRERRVAVLRVKSDIGGASKRFSGKKLASGRTAPSFQSRISTGMAQLHSSDSTFTTLLDPKAWLPALMFFSVNISFSSLPVFLPTIITSMSFSPLTSQLLSSPPYLASFFFVLLVARASDRTANSRAYFLASSALLSSLSYAVIAITGLLTASGTLAPTGPTSIFTRYIAVYGAAMGLFASVVLIITWQLNNQTSVKGRGVAMVMLNVVGQMGPVVGVELFPAEDGPYFVRGMAVCSAAMAVVMVLGLGLRVWLERLNRAGEGRRDVRYEMVGLRGGGARGGRGADADADGEYGEDEDGDEDVYLVGNSDDGGGEGKTEFKYML